MTWTRCFWVLILLVLGGAHAQAAHTHGELVLGSQAARPGSTVLAGVHLRLEEGWHIYWRNPGASGMATKVEWQLPEGITAGPIQWPLPFKLDDAGFVTYVYTNEVVLLVPLTVAADARPGPMELKAKVSWLECKTACVPGGTTVQASLSIGETNQLSAQEALLKDWQKRLAQDGSALHVTGRWERAATDGLRPLRLEWNSPVSPKSADFFPDASEAFEVQGAVEPALAPAGKVALQKQVKKFSGDWPEQLSGVLIVETETAREGYEVSFSTEQTPKASAAPAPAARTPTVRPGPTPPALGLMLAYAFLGGLILNIMPCVLPVIALKILGFVNQAHEAPARVRLLGLTYALGVLVSFSLLAALVIGVKAAGHHAGWGMQFGNPQFLVALTVLVTLVALNLFGLFEVSLGGGVSGAAGTLAARHGFSGAFFNGVLATALATPCTAPFLGTALGFAFAGTAGTILMVFLVAGAGLAAPYVVLSWQPGWLKFLPKPGVWMQRFKVAMGFPMLATAVWLLSLLPTHYGARTLWMGLFLVILGLAAWSYGEFVQRGRAYKGVALTGIVLLLAGGYLYAVEAQLNWRQPLTASDSPALVPAKGDAIAWQAWSPEAVAQAQASGRPVLVDFTADWCLTCQANMRIALDVPSVRSRLKAMNASTLLGDYTRLPAIITDELNRYGRAGVPLVLVYSANANQPPEVLPEVLTPGIVLKALEAAAK